MADLDALIKLHRYELDEKRRALGELYTAFAALEQKERDIERAFALEKAAVEASGDLHFTFAGYIARVRQQKKELAAEKAALEEQITAAKDSLMESFSELKKYEMTQAERDRVEAEERLFKESQEMDEIGIEGHRRKDGDASGG